MNYERGRGTSGVQLGPGGRSLEGRRRWTGRQDAGQSGREARAPRHNSEGGGSGLENGS
jgi:hypothetical protein